MVNHGKNLVRGLIVMGLIAAIGAFFSGCDNNSSPTNNNQQTPLTAEFLIGGVWRADASGGPAWDFRGDGTMYQYNWTFGEWQSTEWEISHFTGGGIFTITIINDNRIRVVTTHSTFYMNRQSE